MSRPTIPDRLVAWLNPEAGARRMVARSVLDAQANGQTGSGPWIGGASDQRYRNVYGFGRSTLGHEDSLQGQHGRDRVILEILDLMRTNEVVSGVVDRIPSYAVFTGIWPQPQTSDKAWNKEAADWWKEIYCPDVDYEQRGGFDCTEIAKTLIACRMTIGDSLIVKLRNGQQQTIEGLRIRTPHQHQSDPNVRNGVRRVNGKVDGYYVVDYTPTGSLDYSKYTYVKQSDAWYCRRPPRRFDSFRTMPDLATAVPKIRDYDETDLYTINGLKIDSMQLMVRKLNKPSGAANAIPRGLYTLTDDDGNAQKVEKHEFGQTWNLGVNEELEMPASARPNAQYVPYLQHQLRVIAASLNLPYEYLLLVFTQGSFSAQIAAKLHARHTFVEYHRWVVQSWLHRSWCWRVAMAMDRGEIGPAPVAANGRSEWDKVHWSIPPMDSLRPDVDEKVNTERFNRGSTSLKALASSRGENRDLVLDEKKEDFEAAIVRAQEINDAYPGADVHWRDFITSTAPGQIIRGDATRETEAEEGRPARQEPDEAQAYYEA